MNGPIVDKRLVVEKSTEQTQQSLQGEKVGNLEEKRDLAEVVTREGNAPEQGYVGTYAQERVSTSSLGSSPSPTDSVSPGLNLDLLKQLVVEGTSHAEPLVGNFTVENELSLTPAEFISDGVTGEVNAENLALQTLTPDKRLAYIENILAIKPDLTEGALRAACVKLQIDPKPFVDSYFEKRTEQLKEGIEQIKVQGQQTEIQIIQATRYIPYTEMLKIQDLYSNSYGIAPRTEVEKLSVRPEKKLEIEISLLGKIESKREELDRVMTVLNFEKEQRARLKFLLVRPTDDEISAAERHLRSAERQISIRGEGGEDETFSLMVAQAKESIRASRDARPFTVRNPGKALFLLMLLLTVLLFLYLQNLSLLVGGTVFSTIALIFYYINWRAKTALLQEKLLDSLREKKAGGSYKRALARSAALKKSYGSL